MSMLPVRESLALGILMNTKGLVELIVLNIGKEKNVLDNSEWHEESFVKRCANIQSMIIWIHFKYLFLNSD